MEEIYIWNVEDGSEELRIEAHSDTVCSLAFSRMAANWPPAKPIGSPEF